MLSALALTLNALVWGVSWWPFRTLHDLGLHPLWTTVAVYLFAIACLLVWKPRVAQGWRGEPLLWLLMLASGLANAGFNWAVTVGDVVRAVLLFYLMPAWAVLLAWPLLGEQPTRAALARLGLALAGVVVVLKGPDTPWPRIETLADVLALLGGLGFALNNVLLRKLNHTPESTRMLAMFGGAATLALGVALAGHTQGLVPGPVLPAPAGLTVLVALSAAFLAGNLALQYGAARLRANTTAVIMLSEVVFASVSSVWLGAGELGARTLLGGALIVGAALLAALEPAPEGQGGAH